MALQVAKIELSHEDLLKVLAPYLGEELPKDAKVYHIYSSPGLGALGVLVSSGSYPEILGGDTVHYAKPIEFDPSVQVKRGETGLGEQSEGEKAEGKGKAVGGVVSLDHGVIVGEPGPEIIIFGEVPANMKATTPPRTKK